jgi:hypothetical protein
LEANTAINMIGGTRAMYLKMPEDTVDRGSNRNKGWLNAQVAQNIEEGAPFFFTVIR